MDLGKSKIETNPGDLMGDNICDCGASEWIWVGTTEGCERILECNQCHTRVYGCD